MKKHWVMDYETIINCFVAVFVEYKTDEEKVFIINDNQNDLLNFLNFLKDCIKNNSKHISFNGLSFDSQITQKILDNQEYLKKLSSSEVASWIYSYAQEVINKSNRGEFLDYPPYKLTIKQLDVFKLNHWDNKAKMSSLKWIQYSMDWHNVEEMPHSHFEPVLTLDTLTKVVNYCVNDVKSTKKILEYSSEQVNLRNTLSKDYNLDLYSASEPRISKALFLYFLEKKTGIPQSELRNLRTHRDKIILKDCILPYINFDTDIFKNVLNYFKTKTIYSTKEGFKYSVKLKDVSIDYGLGGIHGAIKSGVYEATPGWTIMTSDVTSYYPNLAIKNKWAPAHIPQKEFCEQYEWFFEERKKFPKTDPKNYVYKIILNSTYGLTGDQNSFLYDPKMTMQITVNGQLLLSKLAEMLISAIPDANPLMLNTDGLEMMIPTHRVPDYLAICAKWEQLTQLSLEHDEYKKMIIGDVNNYIAIYKNNKVKCKGRFEWEDLEKKKVATFHKNKSFLIIPKAIYAYFVNGVKPEDFLKNNKNIYDYCGAVKSKGDWYFETQEIVHEVPDKFTKMTIEEKRDYLKCNGWEESWSDDNWVKSTAVYKEANTGLSTDNAFNIAVRKESVIKKTKLQKIIRYFISNTGTKIIKCNPDGREIQVEAGMWRQTILNKITSLDFDSYDINQKYYLEEIYKEINNIEDSKNRTTKQLSLF